jgi:hypothetical protein
MAVHNFISGGEFVKAVDHAMNDTIIVKVFMVFMAFLQQR